MLLQIKKELKKNKLYRLIEIAVWFWCFFKVFQKQNQSQQLPALSR